ncbi:MAG: CPBP family glutamic-type intramembrane protease [Microcystaceae cyanobacterium]
MKKRSFILLSLIFLLLVGIGGFFLNRTPTVTSRPSDYSISSKLDFNQPDFYPIQQTVDTSLYQPNGEWLGRLILPTPEEIQQEFDEQDGTWIEMYNAPNKALIGQKIRLKWINSPEAKNYVNLVTTDIKFTEAATTSLNRGIVHPIRLDGRSNVGPLQSLAGARPNDDVIVRLEGVNLSINQGKPLLTINQTPVMVSGRFKGLVGIVGPTDQGEIPTACPSVSPCSKEYFQVIHYNRETGRFDGKEEIVRIPQQPPSFSGRFYSTPYQLESSLMGRKGWYIYGAKDKEGIFTVQALKPRVLLQTDPEQMISGNELAVHYLQVQNWQNTPDQKRLGSTRLVDIENPTNFEEWKEGDKALLIHLFGGIGGKNGDKVALGTVTGHFSYGIAEVVKDNLTDELQLNLLYEQVYAHNANGIISGTHSWESYMGDLARGWVFSRPVSDFIIKLDLLEDYNFNGVIFSPLDELILQLRVMAARYRTGDGTGSASVTPASSCVQDSNQALYIALETLKQKVQNSPDIQTWLEDNPNDPQTLRFKQLVTLSQGLEQELTPEGVVRPDWKYNAVSLAGIEQRQAYPFVQKDTLLNGLLSWRSMLPRVSHDHMGRIFLNYGAKLHFIRTNQIGGLDTTIFPLAPTRLFGETPIISSVGRRMLAGLLTIPTGKDWIISFAILGIYAVIALPIGFLGKFLHFSLQSLTLPRFIFGSLSTFFLPALVEEWIMRVAWLPYPSEGINWEIWNGWAVLGIIIFMLYHPLNAITFYKRGYPTFLKPIFLILAGLLGAACTFAYKFTGSLWTITVMHWLTVVVWLFFLGGDDHLKGVKVRRTRHKATVKG